MNSAFRKSFIKKRLTKFVTKITNIYIFKIIYFEMFLDYNTFKQELIKKILSYNYRESEDF